MYYRWMTELIIVLITQYFSAAYEIEPTNPNLAVKTPNHKTSQAKV